MADERQSRAYEVRCEEIVNSATGRRWERGARINTHDLELHLIHTLESEGKLLRLRSGRRRVGIEVRKNPPKPPKRIRKKPNEDSKS